MKNDAAPRLKSLDSVRGIAALVVVFYHASLIFPHGGEDRAALLREGVHATGAWLYLTPLRLLVAGPAAVVVFFVLSGIVLAITFVERDGERYPPYLIKRITRIWVPFAAAIAVAAALDWCVGSRPLAGVSEWFNASWSEPLSLRLVAETVVPIRPTTTLDNPMWSLVHEMRISLVFPLLALLTKRKWPWMLGISALLSLAAVKLTGMTDTPAGGAWHVALLSTLTYIVMFVAGIVIAMHSRPIRAQLTRLTPAAHSLLWFCALSGLAFSPDTSHVTRLGDGVLLLGNVAAASLLLILSIVEGKVMLALVGPIPRFLGQISYSLYLLHVVILTATVRLLDGVAPLWLSVFGGVVTAVISATVFQRWVEAPVAEWGRGVARRLYPQSLRPLEPPHAYTSPPHIPPAGA